MHVLLGGLERIEVRFHVSNVCEMFYRPWDLLTQIADTGVFCYFSGYNGGSEEERKC
jgi:hypothetical protein